jgi:hypothetical protein
MTDSRYAGVPAVCKSKTARYSPIMLKSIIMISEKKDTADMVDVHPGTTPFTKIPRKVNVADKKKLIIEIAIPIRLEVLSNSIE